ncbi:hypothetical protein ACFLR1_05210 [Bacteroidota bacterium]
MIPEEELNLSSEIPSEQPTELVFNASIVSYLKEACRWGKLLSIVGFVITGLIILFGVGVWVFSNKLVSLDIVPFNFSWLSLIYVFMALIYLLPSLYLYRFCVKTKLAFNTMSQTEITSAFANLKSLFKFFGIFTVLFLAFYAVLIVGMLVAGAFGLMM